MSQARPSVIAEALGDLARLVGADRAGIAVDHPRAGRQVFVDGARFLGELECLLTGPPRLATIPAVAVPRGIEAALRALALAACDTRALGEHFWPALDRILAPARRTGRPVSVVFAEAEAEAVGRLGRPGVVGTRLGEHLAPTGPGCFVWTLDAPSTAVPAALARLVREADLGRTRYAVAAAPADGYAADALVETAIRRLAETRELDR